MKNHSLKYGMIIQSITPIQAEFIFAMANQIGIERGGTGSVLQDLWYTGECVSYCNRSQLCSGQSYVTFEQFITAMVTPESESKQDSRVPIEAWVKQGETILGLKAENEALKKRLAELETKVDMRVFFKDGLNVTKYPSEDFPAFIGTRKAKEGDEGRVLIAQNNYQWRLLSDYYNGQNAVQLIKMTK